VIRPTVQYARADDGVTIAYSCFGTGPVTIVLVSPIASQLEVAWEEPAFEHFVTCLGSCARVVLYDRRGTGLSDHTTASGDRLALPQLARDIEAVLDASGTERAVLLGASLGSMITVQFAVDHPDRTDAIVLVGGRPKLLFGADYPHGMPISDVDEWADGIARRWGTGVLFEGESDAVQHDARFREWVARLERHTCSPGMIAATLRWAAHYDIRSILDQVDRPTLVVHRTDDRIVPVENGRSLAEEIAGASYVELDGDAHTFFLGDQQPLLDAILDFLDTEVAGGRLRDALQRAERKNAYGYGWDSLTPSEREVAVLVSQGLTNGAVAERLRMSRHTVDARLRRVFAKLDVSSRVELTTEYARVSR
jgi:pimeloyl-ACP methyl ester carboxylesterase/DNA-binding CsgD family transcriptional regulator